MAPERRSAKSVTEYTGESMRMSDRSPATAPQAPGAPGLIRCPGRREAAQRLIDLKLVEREMDVGNYARESPAQAAEQVSAFTADHYKGSAEAVRQALAAIDLTPADLQADLAEQTDFEAFIELRFLPAVAQASDQEVEEYYRNHIASAPKLGEKPPSLADSRANIERILANERADLDLDAWLRDQRAHVRITYLESALQ